MDYCNIQFPIEAQPGDTISEDGVIIYTFTDYQHFANKGELEGLLRWWAREQSRQHIHI